MLKHKNIFLEEGTNMFVLGRRITMHDDGANGYGEADAKNVVVGIVSEVVASTLGIVFD